MAFATEYLDSFPTYEPEVGVLLRGVQGSSATSYVVWVRWADRQRRIDIEDAELVPDAP